MSLLSANMAFAQNGAPHTVSARATFETVNLSWQAPASPLTLQWHDGSDYNGMAGRPQYPNGPNVIYMASKWTPTELGVVAGERIDSLFYWQYRPVYEANVQIYENKELVRDQAVNLAGFERNTWMRVKLDNPYTIPADKEVMFVVRFVAGQNISFVANTDREATSGKGDIYSYDGRNWHQGAVGDFMITANVRNTFTDTPIGYNVYCDGKKENDRYVTETSYQLDNQTAGEHTYAVAAVYSDGEKQSSPITLSVIPAKTLSAPAATLTGEADELTGLLSWSKPLMPGNVLTWSSDVMALNIGGTATSNTKVWIKQEFDANDMLAFQNYNINSISAYIAEKEILTATLFVIRDGSIVRSQVLGAEEIEGMTAPAWNTFALDEPYTLESGHTYAYGVYYTHNSGKHPVGVDNTTAVNVKGNSFSTSSPSSTFNNSKPSWRTLAEGNLAGNLMLKANVTPVGEPTTEAQVTGYDLYRDGTLLESGTADTDYLDEVPEPGVYTYTLSTKYNNGMYAPDRTLQLTYTLPAAYEAPLIISSDMDEDTKQVSIEWSSEAVDLQKFGTASYNAGFDEEMTMLYGAKFSAEELEPYAGYKVLNLKFGVATAIDFAVEIRTGDNQVLWSTSFAASDITPLTLYSITLPDNVRIPAGKDIYIVYNATLPGGTSPILLDAGPLVDGGAMISLANGASWMKLGTINSTYNNYNLVIAATLTPASAQAQGASLVEIGNIDDNLKTITLSAADAREGLGIASKSESTGSVKHIRARKSEKPKAVSYNVYRNNELVLNTDKTVYTETLNNYGVVEYYITSIFANGWESPASKLVSFNNPIDQKAQGPYDLTGRAGASEDEFILSWVAPGDVQEMNYFTDTTKDMAVCLTSNTRDVVSYQAIRFGTDTIPSLVGKTLTHVKFKLTGEVKAATAVVMVGDNILYEQEVENPVVGWNVVRLNVPYTVPEGLTLPLGLGYSATYTSTSSNPNRCLGLDPAPAISLVNDVISTSLDAGYWRSLYSYYNVNYGWRISGVFQTLDQELELTRHLAPKRADENATTFNVYRDGELIAQDLTSTTYTTTPEPGTYTVTAVNDGEESAPSNAVHLTVKVITGIDDAVHTKAVSSVTYVDLLGRKSPVPTDGVNIVITQYTDGTQKITKVVR